MYCVTLRVVYVINGSNFIRFDEFNLYLELSRVSLIRILRLSIH